ncbi:hypothetical protein L1049_003765 [Liquidambar formosana]|uniref:Uncharacterized protein n=1 Tax=Liquidambar formosana TaxID=63359 RepID=A0AAP0RMF8_LIQFO
MEGKLEREIKEERKWDLLFTVRMDEGTINTLKTQTQTHYHDIWSCNVALPPSGGRHWIRKIQHDCMGPSAVSRGCRIESPSNADCPGAGNMGRIRESIKEKWHEERESCLIFRDRYIYWSKLDMEARYGIGWDEIDHVLLFDQRTIILRRHNRSD